jgi:hypothetical protein
VQLGNYDNLKSLEEIMTVSLWVFLENNNKQREHAVTLVAAVPASSLLGAQAKSLRQQDLFFLSV